MEVPEGYNENNKVCKLAKSLYGLKQAPMIWNKVFTNFLKQNGLTQLDSEQCIFVNDCKDLILAIYVDHGYITGSDISKIDTLLKELKSEFDVTVYKTLNSFLGLEFLKIPCGLKIKQEEYARRLLEKFNMTNSKSVATPLECYEPTNNKTYNIKFPFREAIGSLLYLSNRTRPDLSFAVNYCSRFVENPSESSVNNIKRCLRFINGTLKNGIVFKNDSNLNVIEAYCDSDFAEDPETRRSTTGFVIFYGGGPIAWCSRRQPMVTTSSTEAEFVAAAECTKELLYLSEVIHELTGQRVRINLSIDNQSAMCLIKNGVLNKRSKHIDVRYKLISEKLKDGFLNIQYCPSDKQVAEIFTKPLKNVKFSNFKSMIVF